MLKTRIITALAVLPVLLIALFWFPQWAWGVFTLLIVSAAAWEWERFCALAVMPGRIYRIATIALLLLMTGLYVVPKARDVMQLVAQGLFVLAALFWTVVVPLWLAKPWRSTSPVVTGLAGWAVIFPAWAAFLLLRDVSPLLLLSLMIIVWVADIGAYFAGRRFGKAKLAAAISPGKTWEGVMGGLIAVMLYFFAWFLALRYHGSAPWAKDLLVFGMFLPLVFLLLAGFSVVGDLFESWMKRCADMKDSSNLLPGHGGVMDRIDALTSALPVAGLLIFVIPRSWFA